VISYQNRLSTSQTEFYDASKPIFTTSKKFNWATLNLFNWNPFPCAPMLDFHNVQSSFPETLIGSGLLTHTLTPSSVPEGGVQGASQYWCAQDPCASTECGTEGWFCGSHPPNDPMTSLLSANRNQYRGFQFQESLA